MLLLQFSTSHYCRKVRLALNYKNAEFQIENLTPGLHIPKIKALAGTTTVPVLLLNHSKSSKAIADSTHIFEYLEQTFPDPPLFPATDLLKHEVKMLEDWLDESIGVATRFVYYDYRAKEGKAIDPSFTSQVIIQVVRRQYGMTEARVRLAKERLADALVFLQERWSDRYLVGDRPSVADLTAAALLSPLALLPHYRTEHPWLFERIRDIHHLCGEPLPPGLADKA
ncbi:glutathione S-transferase family protein [Leptolyngbya sp. AN02str]|uniref:glutathione S-transferase family protein n=1 Tax=Leptolyngbya sp. AN02str TaxID=3423363 RepID=UPI003D31D484